MQVQACNVQPSSTPNPSPTPTPPPCTPSYPSILTLATPANGASFNNLDITLTWNAPTSWGTGCPQDNYYNVYVGTVNPPTTIVIATNQGVQTTVFDASPGTTYYWRVGAVNGSNERISAVRSFTVQAAVSGRVYIDNSNVCATTTPSTLAGMSARIRGTAYSSVVSTIDGTWSFTSPAGAYSNLDLLGMPAGYSCSTGCLQGCPTITSVSSASSGNNFFITNQVAGWWQAQGGTAT